MHISKRLFVLPLFACFLAAMPGKAEITWVLSNVTFGTTPLTGSFTIDETTNQLQNFDLQLIYTPSNILHVSSADGSTVSNVGGGNFTITATNAEIAAENVFKGAYTLFLNFSPAVAALDNPATASITFAGSVDIVSRGDGCCNYSTGAIVNEAVAPEPAYTGVLAAMAGAWGFTNLRRKRRAAAKS